MFLAIIISPPTLLKCSYVAITLPVGRGASCAVTHQSRDINGWARPRRHVGVAATMAIPPSVVRWACLFALPCNFLYICNGLWPQTGRSQQKTRHCWRRYLVTRSMSLRPVYKDITVTTRRATDSTTSPPLHAARLKAC